MDPAYLQKVLAEFSASTVTKTVHAKPYPSIFPTRPELNQAGNTILITGGGTGIGFSIAGNFIRAGADTVVIVGRREAVLAAAAANLETEAKITGTNTKIIYRTCDVVNQSDLKVLWEELAAQKVTVNVLVNNAAKFANMKPLLEDGADEVWSQIEVNFKAPMYLVEKFLTQNNDAGKQKYIINVTSAVIHSFNHPAIAPRPSYTLSKVAAATYFQLLAQEQAVDKVQIVSVHPGAVYNDTWQSMGVPEEMLEDADLSGGYMVWLASKEAAFLHGRTVWATWDVDELKSGEARKRMEEDDYFLKVSVVGLREGKVV